MSLFNCDFNDKDKVLLYINNYCVECSKYNLSNISPVACQYFDNNPNAKEFKVEITQTEIQEDIIESIFNGKPININSQNDLFINELAIRLQIQSLEDISENWEIYELQETESIIFEINDNILNEFTADPVSDESEFDSEEGNIFKIKEKLEIVGTETFCRLIINACISKPKLIQIYLKLILYLSIENVFCRIILNEMGNLDQVFALRAEKVQIICYLVRYFYDQGFIKGKKIQSLYKNLPVFFADLSDNPTLVSQELKANDWSEFKKLVSQGENPNPISKILRNDDIDSFQKISCLPNFDINEPINPSEFESNDFINHRSCSYLEFSAFFCSINCFKYIYLQEESVKSIDLIKYAVAGGNAEIIHICEHIGYNNFKDTGEIAVKFHHWEVFEWLSENKYQSDSDQKALSHFDLFNYLYQSIQFSNFTTFEYLVSKNVDYNLALPLAIDFDNLLLTKWLIKHKKYLFKDESSKSVIKSFLHFACRNENVEMLELLLSHEEYCEVNAKYEGKTPLMISIEKENFELYEILIQNDKIKLNIRDFSGKQVIHFACEHKNLKILNHLLENKLNEIDINSCEKNGNTPLILACENGNVEIVKSLLNHCHDTLKIDIFNRLGFSPILMSCLSKKEKKRLPLIQLLYENIKPEDRETIINKKGPMNKTLLHFACEKKELEIVRYLLSLPLIDINSVDKDNRTPLISAIIAGQNSIIDLLLDHKDIDVTIKDKNQQNALEIALSRQPEIDPKIIKRLRK